MLDMYFVVVIKNIVTKQLISFHEGVCIQYNNKELLIHMRI